MTHKLFRMFKMLKKLKDSFKVKK